MGRRKVMPKESWADKKIQAVYHIVDKKASESYDLFTKICKEEKFSEKKFEEFKKSRDEFLKEWGSNKKYRGREEEKDKKMEELSQKFESILEDIKKSANQAHQAIKRDLEIYEETKNLRKNLGIQIENKKITITGESWLTSIRNRSVSYPIECHIRVNDILKLSLEAEKLFIRAKYVQV